MLKTIKGIYKNGKIELDETPEGITESPVFVTFLEIKPTTWPEIIMEYQGVEDSILLSSHLT
ncbi:MAG: hypothetical protein HEQ35_28480 [Gloeotrichia echinulata IR180]|jgi:hypothetical protein|nr:hypothetical protein [Gloeotrichia echinulata DEX184]